MNVQQSAPLRFPLRFTPLTAAHAAVIRTWSYPPPYDVYNANPEASEAELATTYLNPAYRYYAVLDADSTLIAFRCFGEDARVPGGDYHAEALDMGGGLRPDLTGQRLGPAVMRAAMAFARRCFAPRAFRVTIAGWNIRAQRACANVGYRQIATFVDPRGTPFVVMQRPALDQTHQSLRVTIRHPAITDAAALIELNQTSESHYLPWISAPVTYDQFAAYLERTRRADVAGYVIVQRESQALMGVINISQIFYGNFCSAYMGYYLGLPYIRQGYMKEAIGLALDDAFWIRGLHRIEANIQPDNLASRALVQALGFTQEGYSRRYLRISDQWKDHERWAILADDWRA